jgi:hypothetical protein
VTRPPPRASRDNARRRHGDARLRGRLDELGSITGLRFLARPAAAPDSAPLVWDLSAYGSKGQALLSRCSESALSASLACSGPISPWEGNGGCQAVPEHAGSAAPPNEGGTRLQPLRLRRRGVQDGVHYLRVRHASPSPWRTSARRAHLRRARPDRA